MKNSRIKRLTALMLCVVMLSCSSGCSAVIGSLQAAENPELENIDEPADSASVETETITIEPVSTNAVVETPDTVIEPVEPQTSPENIVQDMAPGSEGSEADLPVNDGTMPGGETIELGADDDDQGNEIQDPVVTPDADKETINVDSEAGDKASAMESETEGENTVVESETETENRNAEERYEAEYEDTKVVICVEAEGGVFPADTELKAVPIIAEGTEEVPEERYRLISGKLTEEADRQREEVREFLAYDIYFLADGEKVEPDGTVEVTIDFADGVLPDSEEGNSSFSVYRLKEDSEGEKIQAYHLTEDTEIDQTKEGSWIESVKLNTDCNSVFAFVRTVPVENRYRAEYRDDQVVITVEAAEGVIPEGAELSVTPVEWTEITDEMSEKEAEETRLINEQYELASRKLNSEAEKKEKIVAKFVAYDICFLVDGEEREPDGQVKVTMDFLTSFTSDNVQEGSEVSIYHLKEDGSGEDGISVENLTEAPMTVIERAGEETGLERAEIVLDSFSVVTCSEEADPKPLTKVETVDTTQAITINMVDFAENQYGKKNSGYATAAPFAPSSNPNYILTQGILSPTISEGEDYPTFTGNKINGLDPVDAYNGTPVKGKSFGDYFGSDNSTKKTATTGLFLKDWYTAKGYYHYASSENGVSFDRETGKFTVYKELTTPVSGSSKVYGLGNFLPYNTFDLSKKSEFTNQYDTSFETIEKVGDDAAKKRIGEPLYLPVESINYHFGMEMLTEFYQRKGGLDEKGNHTIFKFTGDDDIWIYIDGVLVLDLGGCHRAMSGSIDFTTGEVEVIYQVPDDPAKDFKEVIVKNNDPIPSREECGATTRVIVRKSLYDIYKAAGAENRTRWKGDGSGTFADYTTHDFKLWYMERAESASNLKIDFNLSVIPKGDLIIKKEVENTENQSYMEDEEFEFRIMAQKVDRTDETGKEHYKEGYESLKTIYLDNSTTPTSITSEDGFFKIKNGQIVTLKDIQQDRQYYVEERVDADKFSEARINSEEPVKAVSDGNGHFIIRSSIKNPGDRGEIIFSNKCVPQTLEISKVTDPDTALPKQSDDIFGITLQFQSGESWKTYTGKYTIKGINETKTAGDGVIRIQADQTAVIEGLIKGMKYRISESDQGSFTDDPVYEVDGSGVETEVSAEGGKYIEGEIRKLEDPKSHTVVITNANLKKIDITKAWFDNQDAVGKRPASIQVRLKCRAAGSEDPTTWNYYDENGEMTDQSGKAKVWTLSPEAAEQAAEAWKLTIEGLPSKYDYQVEEISTKAYEVVSEKTEKGTEANNHIHMAEIQNRLQWKMVKCRAGDSNVTLDGAEFILLNAQNKEVAKGASDKDGVIEWKEPDSNESYDLTKLEDGNYTISETKAHIGYSVTNWTMHVENGFPSEIKDNEGNLVMTNKGDKIQEAVFYLGNEILYTLPSTGGIGIFVYMIGGTLLMMVSMLILYKRKCAGRC